MVLGKVFLFSAFLAPSCTLSLGLVVLMCLVFDEADRCAGSEACHVGFVGTSGE